MEWTAEGGTLHLTPPKGHQVGMHIGKAYMCVTETHPVSKMCLGAREAPAGAVEEDSLGRPLPVYSLGIQLAVTTFNTCLWKGPLSINIFRQV